jgi:trimethylamine:corrinoid methyltransferase-like protein
VHTETLATAMFEGINFKADFLKQKITRRLFPKEQYLPSAVIDRGSIRAWEGGGRTDAFQRAEARVAALLGSYERPYLLPEQERELRRMVEHLAREAGMDALPAAENV